MDLSLLAYKEAPMIETIEGEGRLESIREPDKVWRVAYRFDITTTHERKLGVAGAAVVRRSERSRYGSLVRWHPDSTG